MLIRASLNYAAHMAAGLAFGALAVIALSHLTSQSPRHAHARTGSPTSRVAPHEPEE